MDKQSKAAELSAGIRKTIEQLANETDAARQSELFRNYLKTSAAFWDYSWHNQMLIWKQRPDASFVGGFNTRAINQQGRRAELDGRYRSVY